MFTGLIDGIGKLIEKREGSLKLEIVEGIENYRDVREGESIAVNGVCLTVESFFKNTISFSLSYETEKRTNLSYQKKGSLLNLERAMRADSRFGGHIVQGHIDDKGVLMYIRKHKNSWRMVIKIPEDLRKYVVKKGSIAVNGISLTISDIKRRSLFFDIIPETYKRTNLRCLSSGDKVNIEVDILGKYIYEFTRNYRK